MKLQEVFHGEITDEHRDLVKAYKRFGESEDGKLIMADLRKTFYDNSAFHPTATVMAYQEGNRDVVLRMVRMIETDLESEIQEVADMENVE